MEEDVKTTKPICTNCDKEMTQEGTFCPHCGQKAFDGRIRLSELFSKFFHNLTLLDGPFIRMVWQLLIPGKVSVEYFKGRIKTYPHPLQFFFVVMFFFLIMVHKSAEKNGGGFKVNINNDHANITKTVSADELLEKYSSSLELLNMYKAFPDSLKSPVAKRTVDTLAQKLSEGLDELIGFDAQDSTDVLDSIPVSFGTELAKIAVVDIAKMPYKEIFEVYHISGWTNKLVVKQFVKSIRDSKSLVNAIISSLTWTILAMSALMSWMLLLFFRKKRGYFVEHFIFLIHFFSGVFLLLTLALLVHNYAVNLPKMFWVSLVIAIEAGLMIAMKKFYQASKRRTLLAWFLFNFIGLLAFSVIFAVGMVIVFMIF